MPSETNKIQWKLIIGYTITINKQKQKEIKEMSVDTIVDHGLMMLIVVVITIVVLKGKP